VVPLLSFVHTRFMIGWANAPYDPGWAERHPKRAVLMALAGPAANLALVLLAGLAVRAGMLAGLFAAPAAVTLTRVTEASVSAGAWGDAGAGGAIEGAVTVLSILFTLNLILFAFNLLPLPPLDGSAVIPLAMGPAAAQRYKELLAAQPALSLLGLLIAWKLFPPVFDRLHVLALNLLYPGMGYG
jgi:Zn-dependent protease